MRYLLVYLISSPLLIADVVTLMDGDRLTGTIQKLEGSKLYLQSKYTEEPLVITWKDVATVATNGDVRLRTEDGKEHTGRLISTTAGLSLMNGTATEIEPSRVIAMDTAKPQETQPGWFGRAWENLSAGVDFGQSYSGLAHYNQLSSNTEFTYTGDRWDASLVTHFDYYGGTESGRSAYQAYGRLVGQRYLRGDHLFLFPYSFLGRQTNAEGGSGQIRQYGGGAGWTFRRQRPDQISLFAGLVRSIGSGFTKSPEGERADSRVHDLLFISAISWEKKLKGGVTTSMRLYYFKPVDEARFHAMATDASAKVPIFGPAYFTVRAYDTPELRQRQLFSTKNLQLSSGIGIEF